MNISFENKRVLITGAGRGIGKELAKAFSLANAETVFALSRTESHLHDLVGECPTIVPVTVDLTDWNATRSVVEKLGPVDILINNAGIAILESFLDVKPESFDNSFNVNLKSMINVSQVVAKGMINKKNGGCIINVSSVASKAALRDHAVYGASKAGVDSLTKTMALELGAYNIRVNAINPTVVWTDMGRAAWSDPEKAEPMLNRIPLHRFVELQDVVNAVLFLASDKAYMINATTLPIEGGLLAT